MHLAPEGFRVRLMEPGEAEALRTIGVVSGLFDPAVPDLPDFVPWLLRHEVFVAETVEGTPAGFAASRDAIDLYWLSGLAVDPAFKGRGVRKALLSAVVTRAGWFFHRAVGLAAAEREADWYRRHRFLGAGDGDLSQALRDLSNQRPGFPLPSTDAGEVRPSSGSDETERPVLVETEKPVLVETERPLLVETERKVMIHWL